MLIVKSKISNIASYQHKKLKNKQRQNKKQKKWHSKADLSGIKLKPNHNVENYEAMQCV